MPTPHTPSTPRNGGTPRTPSTQRIAREGEFAVPEQPPVPATLDPGAVVPIPAGINVGLSAARNGTMHALLGMPRDQVDDTCRGVTNEPLKSLIVTADVGPFRVTGLRPAVDSLRGVLLAVKAAHPAVHASLGTAGMLCVRLIKDSTKLSNHAWGTAIDLSIDGALDGLGAGRRDGKTLAGLAAIAPLFNAAGWFWGVGFSSFEDGMHFEVADETIRAWGAAGALGTAVQARRVAAPALAIGDKGAAVRALQEALATRGFDILPDGTFGPITRGILIDFQAREGLEPDGIAGPATLAALGLA